MVVTVADSVVGTAAGLRVVTAADLVVVVGSGSPVAASVAVGLRVGDSGALRLVVSAAGWVVSAAPL